MNGNTFNRFAHIVAHFSGTPPAFMLALAAVLVWVVTGPVFGFSETWQLVINTGTTIVTFLMVFLIQATQNRDGEAIQAKLDELILVSRAENTLIGAEELSDEELRHLREVIRTHARQALERTEKRAAGVKGSGHPKTAAAEAKAPSTKARARARKAKT